MKTEKQYEYECICGHIWIDSENNGCPMCSEDTEITVEKYESLQPKNFPHRSIRKIIPKKK